jgi:hypothetical protein
MTRSIKTRLLVTLFFTLNFPAFCLVATVSRIRRTIKVSSNYDVFWGTEPIVNSYHWVRATKSIFSNSVFITRYDSYVLNGRADSVLFTNELISSPALRLARSFSENLIFLKAFSKVLFSANLVCMSCDGFIFQHYKIMGFHYRIEFYLMKLAGVKTCVLPYGGDAYVYSQVYDKNWLCALMTDYPSTPKLQKAISKRVSFYVRKSDIFLPGQMLFDGFGRSDWITPSTLCVQVSDKDPVRKVPSNSIVVTHAPNHRGVKGTKFVISAVELLKNQGINIELRLIEKKSNEEVMRILSEESDIHIDQLFFDGYGLNALESMSLGVPTVGNFSGSYRDFFDRWSHTKECPMVIANENNLSEVLLRIIRDTSSLATISKNSVKYVRDFHSDSAFACNFSKIVGKVDPMYSRWAKAPSSKLKV